MTKYLERGLMPNEFDYTAVAVDIAGQMRAAADRVHKLQRAAVLDLGRELNVIKNQVEHGRFVEWVERECQMSIRTAQRAMQAAEMVEKNDKLSYLPPDGLLALSSRAAKPIVDKIVGRIDAGQKPSAAEIKEEVAEERRQAQRAALEAKLTPQQRNTKARREAEEQRRDQARKREWAKREAAESAATKVTIKMLISCLGDHLGEFVALLNKASLRGIARVLRDPVQFAAIRAELSTEMATPDTVEPENDDEPPLPFTYATDQPPAQLPMR